MNDIDNMTPKNLQKQEELIFIHNFQQHSSFNFEIIEENVSPDFIIKYNNQKIGFEITEYFIDEDKKGGSHLKEVESLEQRIINNGRKDYIEKLKPPLHVRVNFRKGLNLSEKNRNHISKILSKCLSNIEFEIWKNIDILEKYDSNNLSDFFSLVQEPLAIFKNCGIFINYAGRHNG